MSSVELFIDPESAVRAETAQSGAFLIGSYADWPNFGDYLQLRSTIAAHEQIGAHNALYILLDISRGRAAHERSGVDLAANGANILPVYYHPGGAAPAANGSDGLVPLPRLPPSALVHIYGGGFVNDWWGRPIRHAVRALLERHAHENADGQLRLFISGLQVSPSLEADAWRPFFARAEYIGARDRETMTLVEALIGDSGGKVQYCGDDALLALAAGCKQEPSREARIAAHVSLADHASTDPDRRLEQLVRVLATAARHFSAGAACDLLVAHPGDHVGEEDAARQLEALYRSTAAAGEAPPLSFKVRNIFREAVGRTFTLGASFLVTCSYHVSLAGLLSHCPTLLLVGNDCYRQKATGLSEAFKLRPFAQLGNGDDVEGVVDALLNERPNRPPGDESNAMWIGQTEKVLRLSRLCLEIERAAASKRLELTASAFREVAANLGELRRRRSLEQKLAQEAEENTALTITIPTRGGLAKYLTTSYWGRRRAGWARSIQKRVKKWA
jgi:hypothetical protein